MKLGMIKDQAMYVEKLYTYFTSVRKLRPFILKYWLSLVFTALSFTLEQLVVLSQLYLLRRKCIKCPKCEVWRHFVISATVNLDIGGGLTDNVHLLAWCWSKKYSLRKVVCSSSQLSGSDCRLQACVAQKTTVLSPVADLKSWWEEAKGAIKTKTYFYKTSKIYAKKAHTMKLIFVIKIFAYRTHSKEYNSKMVAVASKEWCFAYKTRVKY